MLAEGDQERAVAEQGLADARKRRDELVGDLVTITFALSGIGPTLVEELIREHPPTDDAIREAAAEGRKRPQWDTATFAPALLAATVTSITFSDDPDHPATGIDEAQAVALWKSKLSTEDRERLFVAALRLDERGSTIEDLGKG